MRSRKGGFLFFIILWLPVTVFAQLRQDSPARGTFTKAIRNQHARVQATPVSPPFWDDFSFADGHRADPTLWLKSEEVFINNGQAIDPPSLNVATFDGYNENGLPYTNVATETGYRDTLESQPIKMSEFLVTVRSTVYLSFFYQAGGNSEKPNKDDFLKLEFKKQNGSWTEIHKFKPRANADRSVFYDTAIRITDDYFHDAFQFRFVSFGKLSGSYDAWHLDYVYLNRRVEDNDEVVNQYGVPRDSTTALVNEYDKNTNIADRTLTKPMSTIFKNGYYAMPKKHFNPDNDIIMPTVYMRSLKHVSYVPQPVDYTTYYTVTNYTDSVPTVAFNGYIDINEKFDDGIFSGLPILKDTSAQIPSFPDYSNFDENADSTIVYAKISIFGGDGQPGDFYARYGNVIDFTHNDTTRHTFTISDHYAYDDGVAEYAGGLDAPGNQFAYRFVMDQEVGAVTLNGVYFYFPFTGYTIPESMQIYVFPDKDGWPDSTAVYRQTIPVTRTDNNQLTRITFTRPVAVQGTFYIGYQETISGRPTDRIRIGLDASNNTGEHMYYRNSIYHPWLANDEIRGSFMIRPTFGDAPVITGIDDEKNPVSVYPNPNQGEFYVKGPVSDLQIMTLTGQSISFTNEPLTGSQRITLLGATPGLYIVRYRSGAKIYATKILVKEY